jgi:hypothetical protein
MSGSRDEFRSPRDKPPDAAWLVRENATLRSALSVALAALAAVGDNSRRVSECEGRLDGYDRALALLNGGACNGGRHLRSVPRAERSASG